MIDIIWESRTEFHYFADDRLSEAHVTFRNDEWTWSGYIWRLRRVATRVSSAPDRGVPIPPRLPKGLPSSGSGNTRPSRRMEIDREQG